MENQAVEKVGLIPRSILRTLDRFRQQFFSGTKLSAMREFRVSRQQMRTSVRCLITLIVIPLLVNSIGKTFFIKPFIQFFWNNYQNQFFLNSYQENRAFVEMQRFEDRLFFDFLIDEGLCKTDKPSLDKGNNFSSLETNVLKVTLNSKNKDYSSIFDSSNYLEKNKKQIPFKNNNVDVFSYQYPHLVSSKSNKSSIRKIKEDLILLPSQMTGVKTELNKPFFSLPERNETFEKKGNFFFREKIASKIRTNEEVIKPKSLFSVDFFQRIEIKKQEHKKGLHLLHKDTVFHLINLERFKSVKGQTSSTSRVTEPIFKNYESLKTKSVSVPLFVSQRNCLEEKQKGHKVFLQYKFQQKTLELAHLYNQESINAITDFLGDILTLLTIRFLFVRMRPQIIILKSFLTESLYSLSDATKSLLIILLTDLLVGYHSPKGWEVVTEIFLRHYGFPENRVFILFFIGTFPVMLDTIFKYWIFRHLNRISPSTVVTYHSMIE